MKNFTIKFKIYEMHFPREGFPERLKSHYESGVSEFSGRGKLGDG